MVARLGMKAAVGAVAVVGLVALSGAGASPAYSHGLKWKSASNGHVPDSAMIAGREADGQVLFVCRAKYNGGTHPGKIRAEFKGCNIPWGGREIAIRKYEVLTW